MQKFLLWFVLVILALHTAANAFGWYEPGHMTDIPMHMLGGAWIALLFFYVATERFRMGDPSRNWFFWFWVSVASAVFIGAGWEIHEYLIQTFISHQTAFGYMQPGGLFDTLKDLLDDAIGATVAAGIYLWMKRK